MSTFDDMPPEIAEDIENAVLAITQEEMDENADFDPDDTDLGFALTENKTNDSEKKLEDISRRLSNLNDVIQEIKTQLIKIKNKDTNLSKENPNKINELIHIIEKTNEKIKNYFEEGLTVKLNSKFDYLEPENMKKIFDNVDTKIRAISTAINTAKKPSEDIKKIQTFQMIILAGIIAIIGINIINILKF